MAAKDDGVHPRARNLVISLGVAPTVALTLATFPVVTEANADLATRAELALSSASERVMGARKDSIRVAAADVEILLEVPEEELVTVRRIGSSLAATVLGTPGRHVGVFTSRTPNWRDFRLVPGTETQIGKNGRASLRLDMSRLGAERLFVALATAEEPQFVRRLSVTAALEVLVSSKSELQVASPSGVLTGSTALNGWTGSMREGGGKGVAGTIEILSLPRDVVVPIPSTQRMPSQELLPGPSLPPPSIGKAAPGIKLPKAPAGKGAKLP